MAQAIRSLLGYPAWATRAIGDVGGGESLRQARWEQGEEISRAADIDDTDNLGETSFLDDPAFAAPCLVLFVLAVLIFDCEDNLDLELRVTDKVGEADQFTKYVEGRTPLG